MSANTRRHFRVRYPVGERPALFFDADEHEVADISEHGIMFLSTRGVRAQHGQDVRAVLVFKDGTKLNVAGRLLRKRDDTCALELKEGIPLSKMMAEHRALIQKYPEIVDQEPGEERPSET